LAKERRVDHMVGMDRIENGLWIGDCYAAQKIVLGEDRAYTRIGITHVLDVSDRVHYSGDTQKYKVQVMKAGMSDLGFTDLDEKHLKPCFEFIDKGLRHRKGQVLVHCQMGLNRSATVVVAWLMNKKGWPVEVALKYVRKHRKVHPYTYLPKLNKYERELRGKGIVRDAIEVSGDSLLTKDAVADTMLRYASESQRRAL